MRHLRHSWLLLLLCGSNLLRGHPVAGDPRGAAESAEGAEMVLVPAGRFTMGTQAGAPEECPPHQRELPAFYVDRTEVTVARYAAFLAATGHAAPPGWTNGLPPAGTQDLPVTNVRWSDALRYALWAGKRLPTEAEWEKAARGTDGRLWPWGDIDDEARRNKDSGRLRAVGGYPPGASPYGCLDMSGNAWEWTADWLEPYPGATARSPRFGQHAKVVRGGGGESLYGTTNPGTATHRAWLAPYGAHDWVGFRCVQDLPGQTPPYDAAALLREAEALSAVPLPPSRELEQDRTFAALDATGRVPVRVSGSPGQTGMVTMGFPLPRGRLENPGQLQVAGPGGRLREAAAEALARWPDGSLRWALLRFPARSGETVEVWLGGPAPDPGPPGGPQVVLTEHDGRVSIDTGRVRVDCGRERPGITICSDGPAVVDGVEVTMTLREGGGLRVLRAGPSTGFDIASRSTLHADLRWRGAFIDVAAGESPMAYDLRVRAEAGSAELRFWLTVLHAAARQQPWADRKPQVAVQDWGLEFHLARPAGVWVVGGDGGALTLTNRPAVALRQEDDLGYRVGAEPVELARGTRAPGWIAALCGKGAVSVGVRDFWQNHPASLTGQGQALGVRFRTGTEPTGWEGGLAKTVEGVVAVTGGRAGAPWMVPLLGSAAPAWSCGTEAAGALLCRDAEALRHLGYWEAWRETSMRQWVNAMPTGWRDFGDAYMGGPYKGKNAFLNLEYDTPFNFLMQFLRTGERWYFDAAGPMVRHQGDIDTENVAGFAWKHSPLHTTTEAEFGHAFLRGVLLHHLLTGDPRDLEVAERLGGVIAEALERGRGTGNERQIGWALYALSALYEVTARPQYLEAARSLCNRLAREQAPTGKFNIRYDNRIAFFNGIAASGWLSVQALAPDPVWEGALLRLAERTLGMYPEYAGRTLNAWCWVLDRTRDGRFVHNLERTWISSLEFLLERETSTAETHAWRFPLFAVRHGLLPAVADGAAPLPRAASWQPLRFKTAAVDLLLRPRTGRPMPVVVVREGLARGTARLLDPSGQVREEVRCDDLGRLLQSARLAVPGDAPWFRLQVSGDGVAGWQVHHDRTLAVAVASPRAEHLPFLLPRAVGCLTDGAREVVVRAEATGEGFHAATLIAPDGTPVQRVQRFIDFEDPGRYELELRAAVNGPREGWALELNGVKVVRADGFRPYWSARAEEWFDPERSLVPPCSEPVVRAVADAVLRDNPGPLPFDWGEGVLLAGMLQAHRATRDARYLAFVRRFADHWVEQGIDRALAERGYCGQWAPAWALWGLYEETGEERYASLAARVIDFMLKRAERTREGALSHFRGKPELWVDTLAMACPVLSEAGRLRQQPAWQAESVRQFDLFERHLRDPASGLWVHWWDESTGRSTSSFWGRGNGWAVVALVAMVENEPAGSATARRLGGALAGLLAELTSWQDPASGLWHTVLDAPETPLETSASAMFAYGLAKARRLRIEVPGSEDALARAVEGLSRQVDAQGRVVGVSAGTVPGDKGRYATRPLGSYPWGTGAFLMAASAWLDEER